MDFVPSTFVSFRWSRIDTMYWCHLWTNGRRQHSLVSSFVICYYPFLCLSKKICAWSPARSFFPFLQRSPQFTLRYQVRYCDWQCGRLRRRRLINFVTSHVTNLWLKLIQLAFFSLLFFGYVKNASRVKQDEVRKQSLFGKNDPLSCVSKLHVFTVCSFIRKFAGLWYPLQEIIYKNPSQFSGMFWINV